MSTEYSITTAGIDPATDRSQRTRTYLISMGVRFICVLLLFVTPGWWAVLPALGAIFLPYIAVMMANNAAPTIDNRNGLLSTTKTLPAGDIQNKNTASTLLIVDAFAERTTVGERIDDSPAQKAHPDA